MKRSLLFILVLLVSASLHAQRQFSLSAYAGMSFNAALSSNRPYRSLDEIFYPYDTQEYDQLRMLSGGSVDIVTLPGVLAGLSGNWLYPRESGNGMKGFSVGLEYASFRFTSYQYFDFTTERGEAELFLEEQRLAIRSAFINQWSNHRLTTGLKLSFVADRNRALTARFIPFNPNDETRSYYLDEDVPNGFIIGSQDFGFAPFARYEYDFGRVNAFLQLDMTFLTSDVLMEWFTVNELHGIQTVNLSIGASVNLFEED